MNSAGFLNLLGRQIREYRRERGLTQSQLARLAGLSPRYVSQIEAGRGNLSILRLLELTRALGVPLHDVVRLDRWHPIVAFIGLRGAGKSTVGSEVARRLGLPFSELDVLIEEEAGLGLPEIFALHGEAYYRRLERDVLRRFVSGSKGAVLATGGSLVTDRSTFDLLKSNAIIVWLRANPELHLKRVTAQGDGRPMAGRADPLSELRALLRDRDSLYGEADITVETSGLSALEVADEVVRRLEPYERLS